MGARAPGQEVLSFMTKIDIFSGFLGAGKTTLIKKLIAEAYTGEKIVLIENEFGEIAIDGGFLKDSGVQINEMNSGCICCSLVGDFADALQKVLAQFHPDRILIEPSGVGKLSDVIRAVQGVQSDELVLNGFTTVVDANKCRMYMKNFGEFFNVMTPYVEAVAKSKAKKISTAWKSGLQGIIDSYIGETPEKFTYEGKQYTPETFCKSLGINLDDYVSITSYTHHPMWSKFAVEVQDNWRWPLSYNVPMDDLCKIIDNAINNGYTVAWGGDVTEDGFTRKGLGIAYDVKKVRSMAGTDADHWFKLSKDEKKEKFDSLGVNAPEVVPTQAMRQEAFDNWETTDDHGMHIYGIAKDQNGKEYYMVKNSWGEYGDYKGTWYMTKAFVAYKTMDFMVNKNAIPKDIRKKLGI